MREARLRTRLALMGTTRMKKSERFAGRQNDRKRKAVTRIGGTAAHSLATVTPQPGTEEKRPFARRGPSDTTGVTKVNVSFEGLVVRKKKRTLRRTSRPWTEL